MDALSCVRDYSHQRQSFSRFVNEHGSVSTGIVRSASSGLNEPSLGSPVWYSTCKGTGRTWLLAVYMRSLVSCPPSLSHLYDDTFMFLNSVSSLFTRRLRTYQECTQLIFHRIILPSW